MTKEIEGKKVRSKATNIEGVIKKVEKDKIYISCFSNSSIPVNIKNIDDILVMDEETKAAIDNYKNAMFEERSKKRIVSRTKEMNSKVIASKSVDILDANSDDIYFRINTDVLNICFGANLPMYRRAVYPRTQDIKVLNSNKFAFAWLPKMFRNDSRWKNLISENGEYIYEIADYDRKEDWMDVEGNYSESHSLDKYRITFIKESNNSPYKFVGVYEDYKMDNLNHTYKRIATKIRLIGNPVREIEIIV